MEAVHSLKEFEKKDNSILNILGLVFVGFAK